MNRSYFRPVQAPRSLAAVLVFGFDPHDARSAGTAYQAARAAADELGCDVVAWRRPALPGPWCDVAEVGEPGPLVLEPEDVEPGAVAA